MCEDDALRRLVSGLVDEGRPWLRPRGSSWDADPRTLIDHAAKPRVGLLAQGEHAPGRRGSAADGVDYLNGGIVRFGREQGVPTPLNEP